MAPDKTRVVRWTRPIHGRLSPADLEVVVEELPPLRPGQILVEAQWFSVDATLRRRLGGSGAGRPSLNLGDPLDSQVVGAVIASASEGVPVGTRVFGITGGWRDLAVIPEHLAIPLPPLQSGACASAFLGTLGLNGATAVVGLRDIAEARAGETVLVSAAVGGVGNVAVQLAKAAGCRVVAVVGCEEKRGLASELGADAVLLRGEELASRLSKETVDVFLDGVGGDVLSAGLLAMGFRGRVVLAGSVSGYETGRFTVDHLDQVVERELTVRGFLTGNHLDPERMAALWRELDTMLARGQMRNVETTFHGIDQAPQALVALLNGTTVGKVVVALT